MTTLFRVNCVLNYAFSKMKLLLVVLSLISFALLVTCKPLEHERFAGIKYSNLSVTIKTGMKLSLESATASDVGRLEVHVKTNKGRSVLLWWEPGRQFEPNTVEQRNALIYPTVDVTDFSDEATVNWIPAVAGSKISMDYVHVTDGETEKTYYFDLESTFTSQVGYQQD